MHKTNYKEYKNIFDKVSLKKSDLIMPLFVQESIPHENDLQIKSMPGMNKIPLNKIVQTIERALEIGIESVLIFGVPLKRDSKASSALLEDGIVQKTIKRVKENFGSSINIISDVCICQYNLSGHCSLNMGINRSQFFYYSDSIIDNDATLKLLENIALSHARSGADMVAPSAMMDGQVFSIRRALDLNGYTKTKILSYSAKHSSGLYSPFRSAAFKSNKSIDKSSYQVSYYNPRQALREIEFDIKEGADMVMIKPGLAYLDLVFRAKKSFNHPIAVQNVSGEYAMIKAASLRGFVNEEDLKVSTIASIKRAGADKIISYFASDIAEYLQ